LDSYGLYLDLNDAYSKTPPFNRDSSAPHGGHEVPRLTEVKITGDRATGVAVIIIDGKEMKHPVQFVRVGGTWKIAPGPEK
jgi:hypothetical protein